MRIVSGFLKGKRIDFLKSASTRPLRDFVKESMFNVIKHSSLINISLEHSCVLDFYSGVGSFGIECISRGAKMATFIENNSNTLEVLKKNINYLKITQKVNISETKVISFLNKLKKKINMKLFFLILLSQKVIL